MSQMSTHFVKLLQCSEPQNICFVLFNRFFIYRTVNVSCDSQAARSLMESNKIFFGEETLRVRKDILKKEFHGNKTHQKIYKTKY